jgi:putative peptidoglycan lipid II flippase
MKHVSLTLGVVAVSAVVTSYLREVTVAALFGATAATDAYFSAYSVTTTACDLLIGAALLTSCVPVVAPLAQSGAETLLERARFVSSGGLAIGCIGIALALLFTALVPAMVETVVPGAGESTRLAADSMARIMIWLVPINGLLAFFAAVLSAHGRFIAVTIAGVGINATFIVALLVLSPALHEMALPVAALLSPAVTVTAFALYLRHIGLLRAIAPDFKAPAVRLLWKLARPTLLTVGLGTSAGLLTVSHLILRSFGSHHGDGAISALAYAFRIYEVPITLVANTGGMILLPLIAGLHARGERERVAGLCRRALMWGMLLLVPAAMVAYFDPKTLVRVLLGYGQLKRADVSLTADALAGFAPAIIFEAMTLFLFQVLYAIRRPHAALVLSVVSIALTSAFLLLSTGFGDLKIVAACLSASFAITFLASGFIFVRSFGLTILPAGSTVAATSASIGAGVAIWVLLTMVDRDRTSAQALVSLVAVAAGYFAAAIALIPEVRRGLAYVLTSKGLFRP